MNCLMNFHQSLIYRFHPRAIQKQNKRKKKMEISIVCPSSSTALHQLSIITATERTYKCKQRGNLCFSLIRELTTTLGCIYIITTVTMTTTTTGRAIQWLLLFIYVFFSSFPSLFFCSSLFTNSFVSLFCYFIVGFIYY